MYFMDSKISDRQWYNKLAAMQAVMAAVSVRKRYVRLDATGLKPKAMAMSSSS